MSNKNIKLIKLDIWYFFINKIIDYQLKKYSIQSIIFFIPLTYN